MKEDNLFIVGVEVVESYYQYDDREYDESHIVRAENEEKAKELVKAHYKAKDSEYYVKYFVDISYCNEILE